MRTESLCLRLEVRSDGARIAGRIRDQKGRDWRFSSWLGFLTLIERLRLGAPSPTKSAGADRPRSSAQDGSKA